MARNAQIFLGRKEYATIGDKHYPHPRVSDILSARIRRETAKITRKRRRRQRRKEARQ